MLHLNIIKLIEHEHEKYRHSCYRCHLSFTFEMPTFFNFIFFSAYTNIDIGFVKLSCISLPGLGQKMRKTENRNSCFLKAENSENSKKSENVICA